MAQFGWVPLGGLRVNENMQKKRQRVGQKSYSNLIICGPKFTKFWSFVGNRS